MSFSWLGHVLVTVLAFGIMQTSTVVVKLTQQYLLEPRDDVFSEIQTLIFQLLSMMGVIIFRLIWCTGVSLVRERQALLEAVQDRQVSSLTYPRAVLTVIGLFEAAIQQGGWVLFLTDLRTASDPSTRHAMMNALFLVPMILVSYFDYSVQKQTMRLVNAVMILMCAGGVALVVLDSNVDWKVVLYALMISASFWQVALSTTRGLGLREHHLATPGSILRGLQLAYEDWRYFAASVSSLFALAFTVGFAWLWAWSQPFYETLKTMDLSTVALYNSPHFTAAVTQWVALTFAYLTAWFACSVSLHRLAFLLPVLASTGVTMVVQTLLCEYREWCHENKFAHIAVCDTCSNPGAMTWAGGLLLGVSICLFTVPLWESRKFRWPLERNLWQRPMGGEAFPLMTALVMMLRTDFPKRAEEYVRRVFHVIPGYNESPDEIEPTILAVEKLTRAMGPWSHVTAYPEHPSEYDCTIIMDQGIKGYTRQHGRRSPEFSKPLLDVVGYLLAMNGQTLGADARATTVTQGPWFRTGYGYQKVFKVNDCHVYLHAKDTKRVRQGKRWSHAIALRILIPRLRRQLGLAAERARRADPNNPEAARAFDLNSPYNTIYLNDMDSVVEPSSVVKLYDVLISDQRVGGICGRIVPEGGDVRWYSPAVAYQWFEYAFGHHLAKAAESIFGSVLCLPGCHSMYKLTALLTNLSPTCKLPTAINEYFKIPQTAKELIMWDMGEDRLLCTLLIVRGWALKYCPGAVCTTRCLTSFIPLIGQRKRWMPSTILNCRYLITMAGLAIQNNPSISWAFMIYVALTWLTSLLAPGMLAYLFMLALATVLRLNIFIAFVLALVVPFAFGLYCLANPTDTRPERAASVNREAMWVRRLGIVFGVLVSATILSVLQAAVREPVTPQLCYFYALVGAFALGGIINGELRRVVYCGVFYFGLVPLMSLFLTIFCICNFASMDWTTRQRADAGGQAPEWSLWNHLRAKVVGLFRPLQPPAVANPPPPPPAPAPAPATAPPNTSAAALAPPSPHPPTVPAVAVAGPAPAEAVLAPGGALNAEAAASTPPAIAAAATQLNPETAAAALPSAPSPAPALAPTLAPAAPTPAPAPAPAPAPVAVVVPVQPAATAALAVPPTASVVPASPAVDIPEVDVPPTEVGVETTAPDDAENWAYVTEDTDYRQQLALISLTGAGASNEISDDMEKELRQLQNSWVEFMAIFNVATLFLSAAVSLVPELHFWSTNVVALAVLGVLGALLAVNVCGMLQFAVFGLVVSLGDFQTERNDVGDWWRACRRRLRPGSSGSHGDYIRLRDVS